MAISSAITPTTPDGDTQTGSVLDDEIKQLKTDLQERMEDSIIDSAVTGWNTTVSKALKAGIARVHTTASAAKPAAAHDGLLWIEDTAPSASEAFEYDTGATWTPVPIGTDNLIALNVTTAKLAAAAVTATEVEVSYTAADIDDATTSWTHTAKAATAGLTFTITPNNSASVVLVYLEGHHYNSTSNLGAVRIFKSTAGATGTKQLAVAQCISNGTVGAAPQFFHIAGIFTGETAAITVVVEVCKGGGTYHLDGTTLDPTGVAMPIRFGAIEFKK